MSEVAASADPPAAVLEDHWTSLDPVPVSALSTKVERNPEPPARPAVTEPLVSGRPSGLG